MSGVILLSIFSFLMIVLTSLITYEVLGVTWNKLPRLNIAPRLRVLLLILVIFTIHILHIWLYAFAYYVLGYFPQYGELVEISHSLSHSRDDFFQMLYFSAATYTSLGFGDIVPTKDLRMLGSAEVLNGLVMIGWTVSFTYLAMEKFWEMRGHKK